MPGTPTRNTGKNCPDRGGKGLKSKKTGRNRDRTGKGNEKTISFVIGIRHTISRGRPRNDRLPFGARRKTISENFGNAGKRHFRPVGIVGGFNANDPEPEAALPFYKFPIFRTLSPARFSSSEIRSVITLPAGLPPRYVTTRSHVAFFGTRRGDSYFGVKQSGSVLSKV